MTEDEAGALVVVGDEYEQPDDDQDAKHMPPDRDVVDRRNQPVSEDVHQRVQNQDDHEQQELLGQDMAGVAEVDPEDIQSIETQERVQEKRRAVSDPGDDPDQADDVEPAGHPAPAFAAQVVGPPVRPTRGRVLGGQLGH